MEAHTGSSICKLPEKTVGMPPTVSCGLKLSKPSWHREIKTLHKGGVEAEYASFQRRVGQ